MPTAVENGTHATVTPDMRDGQESASSGHRQLARDLLFMPVLWLSLVMALLILASIIILTQENTGPHLLLIQIGLLLMGASAVAVIIHRLNRRIIEPLDQVRHWASNICNGDFSKPLTPPEDGPFAELFRDINKLGECLSRLARDLDKEVNIHSEKIAIKNRSLEILYDVAASINVSSDLDELLLRFLETLKDEVNARAATIRLTNDEGQMELVASLGLDDNIIDKEKVIPINRCLCGKAIVSGELMSQDTVRECNQFACDSFFNNDDVEVIAVPLQHRGKTLGVYNLFVDKPGLIHREDTKDLLNSIGKHLGMAIEKARVEEESKRLSIRRERNMLSHELHDSLAQTLASLRFQALNLDDSIKQNNIDTARKEIQIIRNGLDEAYTELRELLAHFRAPFDERGLIAAIEKVIDRFRRESGMLIFFQNEWNQVELPSVMELQVLRIIQEALNNIKKHSKAHAVRVLLRSDDVETQMVLIEDDGIGINSPVLDGKPGEHIGLSIMKERASRLGGVLRIESEPGEGTRLILTFPRVPYDQGELLEFN